MNTPNNGFAPVDMDTLLDAEIDDLNDLPPYGIPPTGHYNLKVNSQLDTTDEKRQKFVLDFEIEAINEFSDKVTEEDKAATAVGQKFRMYISPFDKEGRPSEMGIGQLKEFAKPFAKALNTRTVSETMAAIRDIHIAASMTRTPNRKDPEGLPNGRIKDIIVL